MKRVFAIVTLLAVAGCGPSPSPAEKAAAVQAFTTVQAVFQHPRCQNCHIPGDQPLQYDASLPHAMSVVRGAEGHGAKSLACSTCHNNANLPASYGPHSPPGAPHWALPKPEHKMAWIGRPPAEVCAMLKDKSQNGGRSFAKLIEHVSSDSLVLWGWHPGGNRQPVSVPHDEFVARFKQWATAGGPCPTEAVALGK
ncbi:MAG: hypothetical protein ABJC36_13330 [Gemmatimonadales bacterium]